MFVISRQHTHTHRICDIRDYSSGWFACSGIYWIFSRYHGYWKHGKFKVKLCQHENLTRHHYAIVTSLSCATTRWLAMNDECSQRARPRLVSIRILNQLLMLLQLPQVFLQSHLQLCTMQVFCKHLTYCHRKYIPTPHHWAQPIVNVTGKVLRCTTFQLLESLWPGRIFEHWRAQLTGRRRRQHSHTPVGRCSQAISGDGTEPVQSRWFEKLYWFPFPW